MKKYLALLALLLCSACACWQKASSQPQPVWTYTNHTQDFSRNTVEVPVWIDDDLKPETRTVALHALAEWNIVLNGYERYKPMGLLTMDNLMDVKVYCENYLCLLILMTRSENVEGSIIGKAELGGHILVIVDDLQDVNLDRTHQVVLHEVGHTLGLQHIPHTIMNPTYGGGLPCVDEKTVTVLAYQEGWDVGHMNWCTR